MKKNLINQTHCEGYIYEHDLKLKVSGPDSKNPGTEFIQGNLSIATDEDCMNVVTVHFSYVTATFFKSGKTNPTYGVLKKIADGQICTVVEHGKEDAGMVRVDSAIGLNEWYDKEGQLISVKRNEGGFVHLINTFGADDNNRATFSADMVITGCTRKEPNEERDIPEKVVIKGAIFDFRGSLMPVEFTVLKEEGMNYFESLGISSSNPVFTKVSGQQISQTRVNRVVEESAFGEPTIRETKSSYKDFVVTSAAPTPYDWDDEGTMTALEFKEAIEKREIDLAAMKNRQDEWRAKQANGLKIQEAAPKTEYKF